MPQEVKKICIEVCGKVPVRIAVTAVSKVIRSSQTPTEVYDRLALEFEDEDGDGQVWYDLIVTPDEYTFRLWRR